VIVLQAQGLDHAIPEVRHLRVEDDEHLLGVDRLPAELNLGVEGRVPSPLADLLAVGPHRSVGGPQRALVGVATGKAQGVPVEGVDGPPGVVRTQLGVSVSGQFIPQGGELVLPHEQVEALREQDAVAVVELGAHASSSLVYVKR